MLYKRISLILAIAVAMPFVFVVNVCSGSKCSLGVVVTVTSGNPLSGAVVMSVSQPEGQIKLTGVTNQGSNKVFFGDIKPGSYQIQVTRIDYDPGYITALVTSGQTSTVKVVLNKTQATPPIPPLGGD